ncbi:hypothetical protein JOD55_000422 [Arcanobacterium pluranimalium]|uniref:hypothetical protein n=1 Tax=Arcanobacterium pluranimalium TaxID=108028 RepID=UPI00195945E4|nr:hypothetical protein [Arcanobacterium pluranimalium]MBM7824595.1 hypothetical protein [Arcanobacterium pluranimalium]
MVSWRPVRGRIERLDSRLTSTSDILDFFAEYRILGRGTDDGDGGFDFELAVGGRRRRVATLDDEGQVFLGYSVNDLMQEMTQRLRKVAVEIGDNVVYGPIDLGAVDIDDADLAAAVGEDPLPRNFAGAGSGEDEADGIIGDGLPELGTGPMLLLADLAMSEMPAMANAENTDLAVLKMGDVRLVISEHSLDLSRKIFPRPDFVVALSAGGAQGKSPLLIVRRNNTRLTWDWSGEQPMFPWVEGDVVATAFIDDELGAGAVARRAVADVVDVTFADIRRALLVPPSEGAQNLVRALGLPAEVMDVLRGVGKLSSIPHARIFKAQQRRSEVISETLAWEIAGEGLVEPDVARAYRAVYLNRPWIVSLVGAIQAGIGGVVLSQGLRGGAKTKHPKLKIGIGAALIVNALSRVLTTHWVQTIFQQTDTNVQAWQGAGLDDKQAGNAAASTSVESGDHE